MNYRRVHIHINMTTPNHILRRSLLQAHRLRQLNANSHTSRALVLTQQRWFSKKWRTEYTKPDKFEQLEEELSALEDEQFSRKIMEEDGEMPPLDLFHGEVSSSSQTFEKSRDFASLTVMDSKDGDGKQAAPYDVVDPWYITEDDFALNLQYEDLPVWSLDTVSDTSKNRLVLYSDDSSSEHKNIPTLKAMSEMALPLPAPPLPSDNRKSYKKYRKNAEKRTILKAVANIAEVRVARILRMDDDVAKQEAVDELFESIEEDVFEKMPEISLLYKGHPKSQELFQKALTSYLIAVRRQEQQRHELSGSVSNDSNEDSEDKLDLDVEELAQYIVGKEDAGSVPLFMDLKNNGLNEYFAITGVSGGIKEDWELAADPESRPIMLREPMRRIAQILIQSDKGGAPSRVFITGKKGVGKVRYMFVCYL